MGERDETLGWGDEEVEDGGWGRKGRGEGDRWGSEADGDEDREERKVVMRRKKRERSIRMNGRRRNTRKYKIPHQEKKKN